MLAFQPAVRPEAPAKLVSKRGQLAISDCPKALDRAVPLTQIFIRVKWNFASLCAFACAERVRVIMKIAQIAPLIESVPPRLYGGTERIASYLTEGLVGLGHDVTLFASGDSITSAELSPCCTRALRLDPTVPDVIAHCMLMIDNVRERAEKFDVLHFHIDLFHFPLFPSLAARTLTTL